MSASIPVINVNLTPCFCGRKRINCMPSCTGAPVLIPLSLEPWRSATLTVRSGECKCCVGGTVDERIGGHDPWCPARPIRVSCSVSGSTWEESEVTECELAVNHRPRPEEWTVEQAERVLSACRARWALVKALVLGKPQAGPGGGLIIAPMELFSQRDAVFAALCDVTRIEAANLAAQEHLVELLDPRRATFRPTPEPDRPSAQGLAIYVGRVIEQMVMP